MPNNGYVQYSFRSSGATRLTHALILTSFSLAILLYGVSVIDGILYPVIYQLGTLVFLAIGAYLLVRCVLKQYVYEIRENGERQLEFVVTEVVGKKNTVVVRLLLEDITRITVVESKGSEEPPNKKKNDDGRLPLVYKYDNRLVANRRCYVEVSKEDTVLIIPEDEKLIEIVKGYCAWFYKESDTTTDK